VAPRHATATPPAQRRSFASELRAAFTPTTLHVATLGFAGLVQLAIAPSVWLFRDDWSAIFLRSDQWWSPQVGHWSTSVFAYFAGMRDVFGVDSFIPYAIPVILVHLAFVHVVWRIGIRVGANAWLVSGLATLLLFYQNVGYSNILRACTVGTIGALVLGLLVLLILDRERLRVIDWILVIGMSLFSLTLAATAVPVLIAAGVVGLVRHGWWRTVGLLGPAGATFLTWWALVGRNTGSEGAADSLRPLDPGVPRYIFHIIIDGLGSPIPHATLGALTGIVLIAWTFRRLPIASGPALPAFALGAGIVAFALATAISRGGLGYDLAMSSRYLEVIVGFAIPLAALALSDAVRVRFASVWAILVGLGLLTVYSATNLAEDMSSRIEVAQLERDTFAAAADLVAENPDRYDPDLILLDYWADDVTVANLQKMMREGWYTPGPYPPNIGLDLRMRIDVMVESADIQPDSTCDVIAAGSIDTTLPANEFVLVASVPTWVTLTLTEDGTISRTRIISLNEGGHRVTFTGNATLTLEKTDRDLTLCTP